MSNAVKIAGVRTAKNKKDGKEFIALDLVQIKPVVSKTTGKAYLGVTKTSITTALSKALAETLVGSELPGTIERVELPAEKHVDWKNPSTGEIMKITHQNIWVPEQV